VLIALLMLACSSPGSVELRAQRRALDAWEEGKAALEAGRHDEASAAFQEALGAQPGEPLLLAWRARAEAEAGDVDGAIRSLDQALETRPGFPEARYHRASLLARAGRPAEAGPDLRRALEDGASTPMAARRDPDFAPYLDHDAFDFLPDSSLVVVVDPLPERAFRGSEVPLQVAVTDLADADLLSVEGLVHGPVSLRRSVEDRASNAEGTSVLLRWDLVLTGVGPVTVGPLSFRLRGEQHTSDSVAFDAVGPEGEAAAEPQRWRLSSATQLGADLELDRPVRRGDRVFVRTEVTSKVATKPEGGVLARHERRTLGQPEWVVWELEVVDEVLVRGVGGERFSGPPAAPAPRR